MLEYSLHKIICFSETAMGTNINAQNESESEYVKAVYRLIDNKHIIIINTIYKFFFMSLNIFDTLQNERTCNIQNLFFVETSTTFI